MKSTHGSVSRQTLYLAILSALIAGFVGGVGYSAYRSAALSAPQQQAYLPQQVSDNYNPAIPAYNQPHYAPAQQQPAQAAPAPAHTGQAQPWDYGQSVTTDIRQMNF